MASYIKQALRPASLHLQICCDHGGTWSVHGLSPQPTRNLPSLSAALDYACRQCGAAPATIELMIDGFYAVVHQEEGWPRQIVGPEAELPSEASAGSCGGRSSFSRLRDWVTERR
jgi:hypothetical protein